MGTWGQCRVKGETDLEKLVLNENPRQNPEV